MIHSLVKVPSYSTPKMNVQVLWKGCILKGHESFEHQFLQGICEVLGVQQPIWAMEEGPLVVLGNRGDEILPTYVGITS